MSETAVAVANVSKRYALFETPADRLRQMLTGHIAENRMFWALRDVSFEIRRGETFGIIGVNGSGKSTLLQIIAGILQPTTGTVAVTGRLAALLELGSGFNPEFTGRENVYLNASILGLSKREIDSRLPTIIEFAEIGEHFDQPVRTYSSGMVLRLAFAVSAHIDPEVLIVDEALAVGDITFRQRCMRRVHQLQARGCTILFVSHDTGDVKALCQRSLWLHTGEMKLIGPSSRVISKYLAATFHGQVPPELETDTGSSLQASHRYGDGRAFITSVLTLDSQGAVLQQLPGGTPIHLQIDFEVRGQIESPIVGYLLRNAKGETLFGSNNAREDAPLPPMNAGETHTVVFEWIAPELAPGRYAISVAVSEGTMESFQVCDYAEDVVTLAAPERPYPIFGYMRLECKSVDVELLPPDA